MTSVTKPSRSERTRSAQSVQTPRRESVQVGATDNASRPGLKSRAHSAPISPGNDNSEGGRTYEPQDGDEIANDSFFQRYHFTQAVPSTAEEPSESEVDSSSDTEGPLSPTHLVHRQQYTSEDLQADPSSSTGSGNSDSTAMQDLNFAVLGARNVGKSTFIRRALGLSDSTSPTACTRKWTIDGTTFLVRFLEMSFNDVQIGERHLIKWPETTHDMATPPIDGAITLYDVTSQDSLARVPEILSGYIRRRMPYVY